MIPGSRLGVYEVIAKLGEGGMGEVYRARDTKLDRDVAIKILPESFGSDPDRLLRFEREAKTLASLNHPHIAQIYGLEGHALVMELVEGEDLSQRIARGLIPVDETLPIAKQIAEALEAAHEQGIIHRDLKPANIKVRADGTVKVLDFGLAKAMTVDEPQGPSLQTITSPAMTMHGVILGTAAYMSPEQARGKPVDRRADTWAFGVVLYEMLTGRRAFGGEEMSDVLAAVLRQPIDWTALPADTPASIRRLLRRCLEKERGGRLADMSSARLEIGDALASGTETVAENIDSQSRAAQLRWRWLAAGLALVSVALAVALVGLPSAEVDRDTSLLRFTLVDDPNMEIAFSSQPFAVSSDGQTVVFSASSGASNGLWVRSLDQPAPRLLAGTEGGVQPALSPDGQWVAFVVANHIIRKTRLGGGTPTTVTTLEDVTASLSWESNDRLLIEKIGSGSGIHRVSANGGEPELMIPLIAGEEGHRVPVVLPGSRIVVFSIGMSDRREMLGVFSLDDGRQSRLGLEGFRALGLIDGHLVYARSDGTVMAAPFDAKGLRVLGEPRALEPKVFAPRFGPSVTLSESGTLVSLPAGSPLSRLMVADQNGRMAQVGEAQAFESARFSPDGRRIAVGIAEGDGVDLWTMDRDTAAATRVTRGDDRLLELESWSADGAALIHTRGNELWTVPVDGSAEAHKLVDIDGRVLGASVLPRSQSVVVLRRERVGTGNLDREELVRVPLSGDRKPVPIFQSRSSGSVMRGLDPRASPDGRWVAIHDRNDNQVHIRAVEGGAGVQVSDAGGNLPVWGHDSRSLYYRTAAGTVRAELQTAATLLVVGRQRVAGLPLSASLHDVSNDGKSFLLLVPVDSAPKVQVTVNWAADVRRQLRARGSQP